MQVGARVAIEIMTDGTIRLVPAEAPKEAGTALIAAEREIVL